jgi:hypothetical protein
MDDGRVEARLDALVEEHRVEHVAGGGGQAEAHVGDTERGVHAGQLGLDAPDRLDRVHGVAAQVLVAGRQGEGQGVEDEVARRQPVAGGGQVVDAVGDPQLPLDVAGLAILVDEQADDGGPVLAGQPAHPVEAAALALAVLEVGRVEHGPAAQVLQPGLDDLRLGRVEHQRHRDLRGVAAGQLVHVDRAVAAHVVDAHVEDVGTLALLVAGDAHARVPVALEHGVPELLGPVGVRALADDEEAGVLVERHRGEHRGGARLGPGVAAGGRQVLGGRRQLADVLGCRAAAAAHHLHAQLGDEPAVVLDELLGREVVVHLSVDHRGQAHVGQARDGDRAVGRQVAQVLVHLGRARGAVEPEHVGLEGAEGAQGRADLGAEQHGAGLLHRDLELERDVAAGGGHRPPGADDRGLGGQQVEVGLGDEQVDAALEQAPGRYLVGVAQGGEPDLAQRRRLGARAQRARHQPAVAVGHLAGDAGRGQGDLVRPLGDVVLAEGDGEGAEAVGLDDVAARSEEGLVQVGDDVGAGDREQVHAALELVPAEVLGVEAQLLEVGSGRPVVDDDALVDEVEEAAHRLTHQATGRSPASRVKSRPDRSASGPYLAAR